MALKKTIIQKEKFYETEIEDAYIRIKNISIANPLSVFIRVEMFGSKVHSDYKKRGHDVDCLDMRTFQLSAKEYLEAEGKDLIQKAYNTIKKLPEFSGAIDILEG